MKNLKSSDDVLSYMNAVLLSSIVDTNAARITYAKYG